MNDVLNSADGRARAHGRQMTTPRFSTRAARGVPAAPGAAVAPLSQAIEQTSAYAFTNGRAASDHAESGQPLYARDGLPNVAAFERLAADLEGAEDAVAVASGMAAITLTLLSLLDSGDEVVIPADGYPETRALLAGRLARFGIASHAADLDNPAELAHALARRPTLLLAETISNPGMRLANLPELAARAHAAGALLCVDNTFASPALCRPLAHGADLVLQSAGKLLAGHHDVTAGVVAGSTALIARLRADSQLFGATLAPMEAWLAVRGIRTLAPRMAWVSRSAELVLAELGAHPAVALIRYPGGAHAPDPQLVGRLLPRGSGGLMAVELAGGPPAAARFLDALQGIRYAATVGGPTTTVSYPPRVRPDAAIECGSIRLSLGLEDPHDIVRELRHALDATLVDRSLRPQRKD